MIAIRPWDKLQSMLVPLSRQERKALVASIEKHGVLDPVLVLPDGRIIDGANRWEISNGKAPHTIVDLDEETALALGVTINIARRQMSPEQIRELQKRLKRDREQQKRVALALRQAGKSQEEAATAVGVTDRTIRNWEKGEGISIGNLPFTYTPPDLKIKVPKREYETIYERVEAGESQSAIAADYKIKQARVSQIVKQVGKQNQSSRRRSELAEEGAKLVPSEGIRIESGDFRELGENIPPDSIDLIFTDPSYGEDYLDLWGPLAKLAARVLKPGRFLLTYCGKLYLPSVLAELGEHLEYYWLAGKYYDQGHSFFRSKKIWDQWRPILIYQKPGPTEHEWFLDMIRMGSREEAKEFHDYGQSLEDAKYYISKLTVPGEIVLDVCCGSGSIVMAAKLSNRRAIGFDVDESLTGITKARLAENKDEAAKVS